MRIAGKRPPDYEDRSLPYGLMFLAGLNGMEAGSTLWLLFVALSIGEAAFEGRHLWVDSNLLWSVLLTLGAVMASMLFYPYTEAGKALLFAGTCMAGFLNYDRAKDKARYICRVCGVLFLAYLTQVGLLLLYNRGIAHRPQRVLYSLWAEKRISVTCVALLCSVVTGYCAYLLLERRQRLLALAGLACVLILNVMTATRGPFVIFGMTLVAALVYGWAKGSPKLGRWLLGAGVAAAAVRWDVFGLGSAVSDSAIFFRFLEEGLQSGRLTLARHHAKAMFSYMWGGEQLTALYGYPHNYLQNAHDRYGFLALVAVAGLTVNFARVYVGLWRLRKASVGALLLMLYTAILPQMLMEPVLTAYPLIFWNFMFIHMLATRYLQEGRIAD